MAAAIMAMDDSELAGVKLVFAVTDEMALGTVTAIRDRGFQIPRV